MRDHLKSNDSLHQTACTDGFAHSLDLYLVRRLVSEQNKMSQKGIPMKYRRLSIMAIKVILLFALGLTPALASSEQEASDKLTEETHKAYETAEWHGVFQGPQEESVFVAKNLEDWNRLWARVSKEAPVSFDPTRDMAIGIFLGTRRTGGYSVEIISSSEDGGVFLVEYVERKPGPSKFVIQALTTPYLIKLFPNTDLDVVLKVVD